MTLYCRAVQATSNNMTHVYVYTNTHSEYVIFTDLPLQLWFHEGASVLLYTHLACLDELHMKSAVAGNRSELDTRSCEMFISQ